MAHSNHARFYRSPRVEPCNDRSRKRDYLLSAPYLRRSAEREIESELGELELGRHDPEVLLWGGMLVDQKTVRERELVRRRGWPTRRNDYGDYYNGDVYEYRDDDIWDESGWDDRYCPCCDSYDRDADWDRQHDDQYDVDSPHWINAWVDGRAELPDYWHDYDSMAEFYDGYDEDGYWDPAPDDAAARRWAGQPDPAAR